LIIEGIASELQGCSFLFSLVEEDHEGTELGKERSITAVEFAQDWKRKFQVG
jgi:hypothetical protein